VQISLGHIVAGVAFLIAAGDVAPADAAVRRRLTIRSQPEGALVYVDEQQIGATPCSVTFTYYGTRKIQLIKDGFQTITVLEKISAPWYQVPPLDFFAENVYGGELRDERVVDFQLEPEMIPPTNELWQRAEALRSSARAGPILAAPAAAPAFPGVQGPATGAPGVYVAPPVGVVVPPRLTPETLPPPVLQRLPSVEAPFDELPGNPYRTPSFPLAPPPRGMQPLPPP
jgi:hypothetical protein